VLTFQYEFAHRRRRQQNLFDDCVSVSTNRAIQGYLQNCPFAVATKAVAQPTLSTSTVGHVRAEHERRPRSFLTSRKSIDTTPFLTEKSGNEKFFLHGSRSRYSNQKSIDLDYESEDEGVHFDETISQFDEVRNAKPRNAKAVALAEKLTGDLFSALGAFNFLTSETGNKSDESMKVTPGPPPMSPLEILEKGAELGSSRALYNIGVAYDRMKELKLAGEYYRRAADLGHPLATYNVAVLTLQDGKVSEGLALMRFAAENGIPEARAVIDSA